MKAFKRVINGRKPKSIQSDRGLEFLNLEVQKYFKEKNINFYTTYSDFKASVVERFNRTLKEKNVEIFYI